MSTLGFFLRQTFLLGFITVMFFPSVGSTTGIRPSATLSARPLGRPRFAGTSEETLPLPEPLIAPQILDVESYGHIRANLRWAMRAKANGHENDYELCIIRALNIGELTLSGSHPLRGRLCLAAAECALKHGGDGTALQYMTGARQIFQRLQDWAKATGNTTETKRAAIGLAQTEILRGFLAHDPAEGRNILTDAALDLAVHGKRSTYGLDVLLKRALRDQDSDRITLSARRILAQLPNQPRHGLVQKAWRALANLVDARRHEPEITTDELKEADAYWSRLVNVQTNSRGRVKDGIPDRTARMTAHVGRGNSQEALGKVADALTNYSAAIEGFHRLFYQEAQSVEQPFFDALLGAARCYTTRDNYKRATDCLELAERLTRSERLDQETCLLAIEGIRDRFPKKQLPSPALEPRPPIRSDD